MHCCFQKHEQKEKKIRRTCGFFVFQTSVNHFISCLPLKFFAAKKEKLFYKVLVMVFLVLFSCCIFLLFFKNHIKIHLWHWAVERQTCKCCWCHLLCISWDLILLGFSRCWSCCCYVTAITASSSNEGSVQKREKNNKKNI